MRKFLVPVFLAGCAALTMPAVAASSEPQLLRVACHSARMNAERDCFVYLPPDFEKQDKWPVILFLHGNGERGDGKTELDYVLMHGPLFEAWCQRKDLPFVIISPQLPMYDQGEVDYIKNRKRADIPQRKPSGINSYPWHPRSKLPMEGQLAETVPDELANYAQSPNSWNTIADELMAMVDAVLARYKGDPHRVYLTGLSEGGKGTWFLAARHPDRFAAIAPVVGAGAPTLAPALTTAHMPIWVFAGGRDMSDNRVKYFYPVLNELERLGHTGFRFTIEADMGHDAWMRVYAGKDLYDWFLTCSRSAPTKDR